MSRWSAVSDRDYEAIVASVPRRVRCGTTGCERSVTFPDFEWLCPECLIRQERALKLREVREARERKTA